MTDPQQEYANALHRIAELEDNLANARTNVEIQRKAADDLEEERDRLRKALQEAKYQMNHSQDTDYIIHHIDKALERNEI